MKTTRRGFLGALASLVACAPLRVLAAAPANESLVYKLTVLAPDHDAAALLGHAYVQKIPAEADANVLADLICQSSAGIKRDVIDAYPGIRHQILNRLVEEDFKKGQTAEVNGWILSRTEARLFALVAVATPPATP